jgi:hypothetical protein
MGVKSNKKSGENSSHVHRIPYQGTLEILSTKKHLTQGQSIAYQNSVTRLELINCDAADTDIPNHDVPDVKTYTLRSGEKVWK